MIDDRLLDMLKIEWGEESPQYSGPRVTAVSPEIRVLQDLLTTKFWSSLVQFIAPGILNHHGRVDEYSGFLFPDDLDPGDESFEGVKVFDPLTTIYVSQDAFDRLLSRYFQAIIEGVTKYNKDEQKEDWWPEFANIAEQLGKDGIALAEQRKSAPFSQRSNLEGTL